MRQKATVIEILTPTTARVRVLRSSMCEGCENRSDGKSCACSALLGNAKEMIAEVQNDLSARAGDDVEIETATPTVLGYAAMVFLLPIVGALLFYALGEALFRTSLSPWIAALVGFGLSFLPAVLLDRINRKKSPRIRIVAIIRHGNEEME